MQSVRAGRSDEQDAEDRAVQVSHTQDPLAPMEVSAIPQVDNKSAASQSEVAMAHHTLDPLAIAQSP